MSLGTGLFRPYMVPSPGAKNGPIFFFFFVNNCASFYFLTNVKILNESSIKGASIAINRKNVTLLKATKNLLEKIWG